MINLVVKKKELKNIEVGQLWEGVKSVINKGLSRGGLQSSK